MIPVAEVQCSQEWTTLSGTGRYRSPQAWIDQVLETDPALANVRLTCWPRYSGRLRAYGRANLSTGDLTAFTIIGRPSLVSRKELVDTIVHEEVHHRLWQRAHRGSPRAKARIADLEAEERYVIEVSRRFFRLQHHCKFKRGNSG